MDGTVVTVTLTEFDFSSCSYILTAFNCMFQVERHNIRSYTCDGKPPHLELTFTATSDQNDLSRAIVVSGIKDPNRFMIQRMVMPNSDNTTTVTRSQTGMYTRN